MKYFVIVAIVAIAVIAGLLVFRRQPAAKQQEASTQVNGIRYLPLGDSYTIGQSVSESERWPNQLVSQLATEGITLGIVANPSVTGYTTQDLINRELPVLHREKPAFVTLQIGVNDWVHGLPASIFRKNLAFIIDDIQATLPDRTKLLLVTIPDYGLTPTGAQFGSPEESHKGVLSFNAIINEEAAKRGLKVADVFPASEKVADDNLLIAPDGLHPSGKQYTDWVSAIKPPALEILK